MRSVAALLFLAFQLAALATARSGQSPATSTTEVPSAGDSAHARPGQQATVDTHRSNLHSMGKGLLGAGFSEYAECPEMVAIPAGHFIMGSAAAEKAWAATHGASLEAVADEGPQHEVILPTFALGRYDVTREEYAAFVRETGHSVADGCGHVSFKWDKDPKLSWRDPGFAQSGHDPVVCVS